MNFLQKARETTTDTISLEVPEERLDSSSKKCTCQSEESSQHWDLNGGCLCRPGLITGLGAIALGSVVPVKIIDYRIVKKKKVLVLNY